MLGFCTKSNLEKPTEFPEVDTPNITDTISQKAFKTGHFDVRT